MKEEKKEFPKTELKFSQEMTDEKIKEMVEKRNKVLRQMGYEIGQDGKVIKGDEKKIIYFKLTSGVILKIDRSNFTAYRFNQELKEWQEDSVLFTEYEHGNLEGKEFEAQENFPYGEPFHFGRHL